MPTIIKMAENFINLDAIRFIECPANDPPILVVHWTNGQKTIVRDNDAKHLYEVLSIACSPDSSPT